MKNYNDIINTKYPFKTSRKRMSNYDRAAQFSAFKALSGYEEEIEETSRKTDQEIELDENEKEIINSRIQVIEEALNNHIRPQVQITYFTPDLRKDGGAYITANVTVKRIDKDYREIKTTEGLAIPIEYIYKIDGEIFNYIE